MSVFLTPIYTQTVGAGGVSSITFNNIPQSFTDLYIYISGRSGFASNQWDDIGMRFNGSSTGYSHTISFAVGASNVISGRTVSAAHAWAGWVSNSVATASSFGNNFIHIPNYNSANFKTWSTDSVVGSNSATLPLGMLSGTWRNSSSITSINIFSLNSATLLQNTTVTIYGVSNVYDTASPTAPTIGTVTDQAGFLSVPFTPASNDGAKNYAVTTSPSSTTAYGSSSPILIPVSLGTSYTASVSSVNSLGSAQSSSSNSVTTTNNYTSIATQAISSNTSSILFTNIPQNYKNLQLRIFARGSNSVTSDYSYINFNEDGSGSYSSHYLSGNGTTSVVSGYVNSAQPLSLNFPCANANANVFGSAVVDILDYTNTTKFKTARIFNGWDNNGSGNVFIWSIVWSSLNPITSIKLIGWGLANYVPNSHVALYGIG